MEILGIALMGIGFLVSTIYGIILLVKAFQTSVWWGLGSLFVPFVSLIFVGVHWQVAKKPFLMGLIGIPLIIVGTMLMPHTMTQVPVQ